MNVTVMVQPSGIAFSLAPDETVIEGAWRAGLWWPTLCGGRGSCKMCVFRVLGGAAGLSPLAQWEREGLQEIGRLPPASDAVYRMACQASASTDIVVQKPGVRRATERSAAADGSSGRPERRP